MPRKKQIKPWSNENHDAAIPETVRRRLWKDCGGICGICALPIADHDRKHLDHTIPLEDGGAHAEHNLRWVHHRCHQDKTGKENSARAKANRIWSRHLGLKEPSAFAKRYARLKLTWKRNWKTGRMERIVREIEE